MTTLLNQLLLAQIIIVVVLTQIASAINGNGRQAFQTYDGWMTFEIVTQGDVLDGFEMPGNGDGIGVSRVALFG
jgi:hypothetical protein